MIKIQLTLQMMSRYKQLVLSITFLLILSNSFAQVPKLALADSLAKEILENEGLYTVASGLKPMSTVLQFDFQIDTLSQEFLDEKAVEASLSSFHSVLSLLENENIKFIILPFKSIYGDKRTFQILVFNQESVEEKVKEFSSFFLKRGILPETPVHQILSIVEFGEKYERYQAYGYFFGYPEHAVNFFVNASLSYEQTNEFVERDFFQIPVASSEEGHFVYAVPKGYEPAEIDLRIRLDASEILSKYKEFKSEVDFETKSYPFLELYFQILDLAFSENKEEVFLD
ncbi:hypothetical protein [Algoriphagus formosus]|uniref:hypothetical protein n=1 Tax=Algoriphagus formosus TaxID=2007308 RepID=UPI003F6FA0F4